MATKSAISTLCKIAAFPARTPEPKREKSIFGWNQDRQKMTANEIISLLAAMGFGAILQSVLNFYIASRKKKSEQKQQFKETRYKAIILLCHAYINYESEEMALIIQRPDIKSREALFNELKAEWINMVLYASDKVILTMKKFLESNNKTTFNEMVLAMRKDLYGIRTKLKMDNLDLIEKNLDN